MSSTWNGLALQTRFAQKFGLSDSTSLLRIMEWINEIQLDIAQDAEYPFLKFKMKKYIAHSEQEISLAPQVPNAPVIEAKTGGSLIAGTEYSVKMTFVLFAEDENEFNSIESEPSQASNIIIPATTDLSITMANLDTYLALPSVKPLTIHRRIYLKKGSGDFVLAATIYDNSTITLDITTDTSSTIEPPEHHLVTVIAGEDLFNESNKTVLMPNNLQEILEYDPGLSSTGTPNYYARISKTKVLIYPRPSTGFTLSYWIFRLPQRIFPVTDRVIQLEPVMKTLLDAGVTWKGFEYKDSDGVESKLNNYETMKSNFKSRLGKTNSGARSVRVVQ